MAHGVNDSLSVIVCFILQNGQYDNAGLLERCARVVLHRQVAGSTRSIKCDTVSPQAGSHSPSSGMFLALILQGVTSSLFLSLLTEFLAGLFLKKMQIFFLALSLAVS